MTDTITLPLSVVEQALEALNASMPHNNDMDHDWPSHIAARRALRAALEQPQGDQESVAWIENIGGGVSYNPYHEAARKLPDGVRFDLYTHPQNLNCKSTQARLATLWGYERPQPKREPLTDDELDKLCPQFEDPMRREMWKLGFKVAHNIKD